MAQEKAANSRMSVDSGPFVFHYLIEADVCYLTLTDKSYPRKLAYQYLEELQSEFTSLYGQQIEAAARPYAFIKFGESAALAAAGVQIVHARRAWYQPVFTLHHPLWNMLGSCMAGVDPWRHDCACNLQSGLCEHPHHGTVGTLRR